MRPRLLTPFFLAALATVILAPGTAAAGDPIPDDTLGLSQTSVFDTPVPEGYDYEGSASRIDLQSSQQAPVIPHEMRAYETITTGRNRCLRCHMEPDYHQHEFDLRLYLMLVDSGGSLP